jgi:hypothetical protein
MTRPKAASSSATGLTWLGAKRFIPGVPSRDLSAGDLERLVYRRLRLRPGDKGFDEALAARTASLIRSGLFASADTSSPAAPPPAPASPDPDAPPADPALIDAAPAAGE